MPAAPRTVSAFGEYGTWTVRPVKPPPPHPSVVPRRDGSRRSTHSPSRAARPSGPPWARGGWAGAKAGSWAGAGGAAGPAAVAFVPRGVPAQAMRVTAVTRAAAIESRRRGEIMGTCEHANPLTGALLGPGTGAAARDAYDVGPPRSPTLASRAQDDG